MIAWLLAACLPRAELDRCPRGPHLLLSTTDYEGGALASVDPHDGCTADLLASTGPDAIVRTVGDRVLVANRAGGESVVVYEPGVYDRPITEFALDGGGNVHDVAAVGDEWWFTLYERAELVRTDPDGTELGRIDLSAEADADGLPEADRLVVLDSGVYVGLQRLDRDGAWSGDDGRIVRIDPGSAQVVDGWDVGPNPKLYPDPADPTSIVVLTGRYFRTDGALLRFRPDDGSLRPVVTEAELGRDFSGFAGVGEHGVLLAVDLAVDGPSTVSCVDLASGAVTPGLAEPSWFVDAVADGDRVFVAVRAGFTGVGAASVVSVDPVGCAVEPLADGFRFDPYGIARVP